MKHLRQNITPVTFAPADGRPITHVVAMEIAFALQSNFPGVQRASSLDQIREHARSSLAVVIPTAMNNLEAVSKSGALSKLGIGIVGWSPRLGMAHWDLEDVKEFLQSKAIPFSVDFHVDFGTEFPSSHHRAPDTNQRLLSVSIVETDVPRCLPVIEVLRLEKSDVSMYFPDESKYVAASLDDQTLQVVETIALALHRRFCVDLSRVELVLNFEGDIDIEISALAFYPYPLLSESSLFGVASQQNGKDFVDLLCDLVNGVANRIQEASH